jgi:hypothetical protein
MGMKLEIGNSMRTRISDNCYCSIHESAKKTFGPEDIIWYRINKEINNALWRSVDDAVYWTIEDSIKEDKDGDMRT